MREKEIEAFLSHLAVDNHVSASTQNQALAAILFLYRNILEIELEKIDALRANRPERVPVVLSIEEVRKLLDVMSGREKDGLMAEHSLVAALMVELMYGFGMRVLVVLKTMSCVRCVPFFPTYTCIYIWLFRMDGIKHAFQIDFRFLCIMHVC